MRQPVASAKAHCCVSFVLRMGSAPTALSQLTACLGICIALFSFSSTLHAQSLSGIRGTVTDQSGSTISNARVSIANADTGGSVVSEAGPGCESLAPDPRRV
jgi:hypothetical protein